MVGLVTTSSRPDAAPVGITTLIAVLLHEVIVTGLPFRRTTLPPCEVPKFEPLISTESTYRASRRGNVGNDGSRAEVRRITTLSRIAVARFDDPLLTANPMSTPWAMLIVVLDPHCVQLIPSADTYELKRVTNSRHPDPVWKRLTSVDRLIRLPPSSHPRIEGNIAAIQPVSSFGICRSGIECFPDHDSHTCLTSSALSAHDHEP